MFRKIKHKISTYPPNERISKNKHTANCYRKIRTAFRDTYVEELFEKPMAPAEYEFFQNVKKYLNLMEKQLVGDKHGNKR